jgi:hypothetical protein
MVRPWGTHWEPKKLIDNLMGTHWELERNMLGINGKMENNPSLLGVKFDIILYYIFYSGG